MHKILWCYHLNETSSAVLSHVTFQFLGLNKKIECLNPIQTGLFWSICDWGGGLLGPPLCISETNNARVMKFRHNDHLRTKTPHTQF